jgi:hypothetical protein
MDRHHKEVVYQPDLDRLTAQNQGQEQTEGAGLTDRINGR